MSLTINVSPRRLKHTAASLNSTGKQIRSITSQMTNTVHNLSGSAWAGKASQQYVSKFDNLQGDIRKIVKMIDTHCDNLTEMADEYSRTEERSMQRASRLRGSAID